MKLVSRKRALAAMRKRDGNGEFVPFSVVACKLNKATGEGGGRLHVKKAVIYKKNYGSKKKSPVKRNPHHEYNGTINIRLIPSGEIRAIHIRLIEKFNGSVVYD